MSFLYEYAPLCEGRHACLTEYLPFHILRCLSNAIFVPGGGCRCSIGLEIPSHSGDMFCFFCRFSFFFGSFVFVFHFHCLGHRALCCLSQHISHFECYSHRNKWHLCHLSICLSIYTSIHPYMQHAPVAHLSSLAEKTQTN